MKKYTEWAKKDFDWFVFLQCYLVNKWFQHLKEARRKKKKKNKKEGEDTDADTDLELDEEGNIACGRHKTCELYCMFRKKVLHNFLSSMWEGNENWIYILSLAWQTHLLNSNSFKGLLCRQQQGFHRLGYGYVFKITQFHHFNHP